MTICLHVCLNQVNHSKIVCVCKNARAATEKGYEPKKEKPAEKQKETRRKTDKKEGRKAERDSENPEISGDKDKNPEPAEKGPIEPEAGGGKPEEPEGEAKPEKPEIDEENTETAEEKPETEEEKPETEEEKPETEEEKPETEEEKHEAGEEKPPEEPTEPEPGEEKPAEPELGEEEPAEPEPGEEEPAEPEKPEEDGAGTGKPGGDGHEGGPPKPDEDGATKPELSSSSESLPSTCSCLKQDDDCDDIMGKPTAFVYDNPCFGQHEMYMDPIYKLFPEDCDTYCGPHIEIPWSDLTIPRNIKLRISRKPKSDQKTCNCGKGEEISERKAEQVDEVIVCGDKDGDPSAGDKTIAAPDDDALGKGDKSIEIQLSFTQITENTNKTDNKCTDVRPTSTEKGTGSRTTSSNFSCRCAGSRLQQSSPIRSKPSKSRSPQCKCARSRSSVKINPNPSHSPCENPTCEPSSTSARTSRRSTEAQKAFKRTNYQDPVMNVLETCEAEMVPLRDTLNQLKSKIRNLNIPELSNWNGQPAHNTPRPQRPPMTMPMMPQQSVVDRPPCCASSPTQNFQTMSQTLAQCPFQSMFPGMPSGIPSGMPSRMPSGMPSGMPCGMPSGMPCGMPGGMGSPMPSSIMSMQGRAMPSMRGCCPRCSCKEMRSRRRSGSSSTDYSEYEYDSVSEGESMCPFLRALSSKNIYKEKESKSRRRSSTRDDSKTAERSKRKSSGSAKRYNKRSQVEYCRNDNCTDTEPEIQVHYEPKRPRMKTKQVFKTVVDPNMVGSKNQRLRIAVRVTPSGEEMYNDKLLAIQGSCDPKEWGCRRSQ